MSETCCCKCEEAAKVSIHGMFGMHLFHRLTGSSPEGVVANWRAFNANLPYPAIVGGKKVDDLGPIVLCPIIVLSEDGKELRRVGKMVHRDEEEPVEEWLRAANADRDVCCILRTPQPEPAP